MDKDKVSEQGTFVWVPLFLSLLCCPQGAEVRRTSERMLSRWSARVRSDLSLFTTLTATILPVARCWAW